MWRISSLRTGERSRCEQNRRGEAGIAWIAWKSGIAGIAGIAVIAGKLRSNTNESIARVTYTCMTWVSLIRPVVL